MKDIYTKAHIQMFIAASFIMPKLRKTHVLQRTTGLKKKKKPVVNPYLGILLNNKKKQTIGTHNKLDESPKNYAE